MANWRLPMYGLVLILTMRIRPEGLMGYKELSLKPFKRLYRKLRGSGKEGREV